MEWLSSVADQVILFFQSIWDFFAAGIYTFVKDAFVVMTKACIYAYFTGMVFVIDVGYSTSSEIINSLGVSAAVKSAFGALPPDIQSGLSFFGVPQALNIIFSALSTRFCMRFVPFMGR